MELIKTKTVSTAPAASCSRLELIKAHSIGRQLAASPSLKRFSLSRSCPSVHSATCSFNNIFENQLDVSCLGF